MYIWASLFKEMDKNKTSKYMYSLVAELIMLYLPVC